MVIHYQLMYANYPSFSKNYLTLYLHLNPQMLGVHFTDKLKLIAKKWQDK